MYKFNKAQVDGNSSMSDLLGGKGANLAEMVSIGIPVPAGCTIPTTECTSFFKAANKEAHVNALAAEVVEYFNEMRTLYEQPEMLLAIRSGAKFSMPGMMDTVLNVGITRNNLPAFIEMLGERTALDCYRRFLQMYGEVVRNIPAAKFEAELDAVRSETHENVTPSTDAELTVTHLRKLVDSYESVYNMVLGAGYIPKSPKLIIRDCIWAVFGSWNTPRAKAYRAMNNISEDLGTAVNVQAMVYGNMNEASCSGVLFSRNPNSGEKELYGNFLVNAQGEDVVAGIRTPQDIAELADWNYPIYKELAAYARHLEEHYGDMQDMEFTVQDNVLYILQTRSGKRASKAAFRIAHDLVKELNVATSEAARWINPSHLDGLNAVVIDPTFKTPATGKGIGASGEAVSGTVVLTPEEAVASDEPTILFRHETSPDDFEGMAASVGIVTLTGGETSHAAVVARSMNKACVVGADFNELSSLAGRKATIDGATGRVWIDVDVPFAAGGFDKYATEVCKWLLGSTTGPLNVRLDWERPVESLLENAPLERAVSVTIPAREFGNVTMLIKSWVEATDQELILDFNPSELDATDDFFSSVLLGGNTPHPLDAWALSKALKSSGLSEAQLAQVTLVAGTDTISHAQSENMREMGLNVARVCENQNDLLNGSSELIGSVSDAVAAKIEDTFGMTVEDFVSKLKDAPNFMAQPTDMALRLFEVVAG